MTSIAKLSNTAKLRLLLLVFCGVAVLVSLWPSTDHSVRGLVLRLRDEDSAGGRHSDEVVRIVSELRAQGGKVVPVLLQMLKTEPNWQDEFFERVSNFGQERHWWTWEYDYYERIKREKEAAVHAMGVLGTTEVSAVTALVETPHDYDTRDCSVRWALGEIGKGALPGLVTGLTNSSPVVRIKYLMALTYLGSNAWGAYPQMRLLLADPEPWVRRAAAFAIGSTAPTMADAVSAFAPLRQAADAGVRNLTAEGLRAAAEHLKLPSGDPAMKEAAALIASLLTDPDKDVRRGSFSTMVQFKEAAGLHIAALLLGMDDADEDVSRETARTLGFLHIEPATVIAALAAKLDYASDKRRLEIAVALRGFGDVIEKYQPGLSAKLGTLGQKEFEDMQTPHR